MLLFLIVVWAVTFFMAFVKLEYIWWIDLSLFFILQISAFFAAVHYGQNASLMIYFPILISLSFIADASGDIYDMLYQRKS